MPTPTLTATQKMSVKRHLGYHSVSQSLYPLIDGFASIDTILTDLDQTPETVTETIAILTRLDNLEAAIGSAPVRLKAAKVSSIELNHDELDQLWRELKRWRRELSVLIGIPLRNAGARMMVV